MTWWWWWWWPWGFSALEPWNSGATGMVAGSRETAGKQLAGGPRRWALQGRKVTMAKRAPWHGWLPVDENACLGGGLGGLVMVPWVPNGRKAPLKQQRAGGKPIDGSRPTKGESSPCVTASCQWLAPWLPCQRTPAISASGSHPIILHRRPGLPTMEPFRCDFAPKSPLLDIAAGRGPRDNRAVCCCCT